jgi:CheY-like chemotaxis protein
LGLAIVKNLVEPQGGTITVQSKPGEGSTFSFILSFRKTQEKVDLESDLGVELEAGFKNIKILVVEDIALNQLLMKTLLEEFGFEMEVAGNGKIAIEKLLHNTYDIILMDLQMPEMNGFEATEYIRNVLHSQVPIIALTADVTTVDVEKCKAAGMNDYISKPIDDKLLYRKIIKYLKEPDQNKNLEPDGLEAASLQQVKCVNFDYLRRITKSNARMAEMIQLYMLEVPQLVQTMKTAIAEKNWASLKITTHSLIPTFSTIGINVEFEDMAKAMQAIAATQITAAPGSEVSDEMMDILGSLCLKIENICDLATEELEAELLVLSK